MDCPPPPHTHTQQAALAVLIDADNINASYAGEIFDVIGKRWGRAVTKCTYGNLSAFYGAKGWKEAVLQYALEAYPQVPNTGYKNNADFALIIHAMDLLAKSRYDGFVIVSSDSDFTSLVIRLRNEMIPVYGIGDGRACASFRRACTEFVELTPLPSADNGVDVVTAGKTPAAEPEQSPAAASPPKQVKGYVAGEPASPPAVSPAAGTAVKTKKENEAICRLHQKFPRSSNGASAGFQQNCRHASEAEMQDTQCDGEQPQEP